MCPSYSFPTTEKLNHLRITSSQEPICISITVFWCHSNRTKVIVFSLLYNFSCSNQRNWFSLLYNFSGRSPIFIIIWNVCVWEKQSMISLNDSIIRKFRSWIYQFDKSLSKFWIHFFNVKKLKFIVSFQSFNIFSHSHKKLLTSILTGLVNKTQYV